MGLKGRVVWVVLFRKSTFSLHKHKNWGTWISLILNQGSRVLLLPEFGSMNLIKGFSFGWNWLICLVHAISNDHFQMALCSSHEKDCWVSCSMGSLACVDPHEYLVMCCQFLGSMAWVQVRPSKTGIFMSFSGLIQYNWTSN